MHCYLNHYCEFFCLAVACFQLIKTQQSFFAVFTLYLLVILSCEISITYLIEIKHIKTMIISNCLNTFILLFNAGVFIKYVHLKLFKRLIIALSSGYIIWWLICVISRGTLNYNNPNYFIVAALIQILICLLYFYFYLLIDDITHSYNYYLSGFIIALGIFIFNTGAIISFTSANIILKSNLLLFGISLKYQIPRILCIPLYSLLAYALLKWKPLHPTKYIN